MEISKILSKPSVLLLFISAKIPAVQQELSVPLDEKRKSTFNDDQMPLSVAKINNESKLSVKNLGKQIKWDYVFFVEYGGPLLIFPLLYLLGAR